MSLRLTPKFVVAGFLLASLIAIGTFYVVAQNGPSSEITFSDEVTLTGSVVSIDEDHGFTMVADSVTYYIGIPYTFDKSVLGLTIGSEVTVTGYVVDSPMMGSSSFTMFHATSVNGIIIDSTPQSQSQSRSGNCGGMGNGNMSGQGPHHGKNG